MIRTPRHPMAGVFFFYRGPELFGSSLIIAHTTAAQPPSIIPAAMGHTWHPGSPPRPGCSDRLGGPNLGFSLSMAHLPRPANTPTSAAVAYIIPFI